MVCANVCMKPSIFKIHFKMLNTIILKCILKYIINIIIILDIRYSCILHFSNIGFSGHFLSFLYINTSVFGHSMSSVKSEVKARISRPSAFQRSSGPSGKNSAQKTPSARMSQFSSPHLKADSQN